MKKIMFVMLLFMLASTVALSMRAWAGPADSQRPLAPYFVVEGPNGEHDGLPLKRTDAMVHVNGVIAHVLLLQTYRNEGSSPINATYVFPASTRAAVHGMKMTIGEHVIKAKIKERQQAIEIYEQAKTQGKSASLLSQQRPNVLTMDVANIMPGDTVEVELKYTELLTPTDKTYEFVLPTVVGPRYSGESESGAPPADQWVKSPYFRENLPPSSELDIHVVVSSGIPIQEAACESHETDIRWENESRLLLSLADSERHGADRDFIFRYRLAGREISDGLLLYEGEDENFFLVMMQPPQRVAPETMPPREYIFVVDVSGSMHGYPLNVSKRLLRSLIGGLRSDDLFNVVLFAGGAKLMSPVSVPGTRANIDLAVRTIDGQTGGGGTELRHALDTALAIPSDENRSRSVLIVSDGYICAEKDVFQLIDANLDRTNFFAFGIGSSVNRYLMEGIAKVGRGEPFIVTEKERAEAVANRFRDYVGAPVLTGISVDFEGFDAYDTEPELVPDLFADRPLTIFGKYHGPARGVIKISGRSGEGEYFRAIEVSETSASEDNRALPYLWARSFIARLSDFNPQNSGSENREQIVSLGLTYNLLTAHTSFVAVHEEIRNPSGAARDVKQPLPLPQHVSNLAVGGGMSNVPEPGIAELAAGALLLLAFFGVAKRATRRVGRDASSEDRIR